MVNLRKLVEQQKHQRALKIKNKILKRTHDTKLAGPLSPIFKKLEEVKESTQKSGDVMKVSNSEINKETVTDKIKYNTLSFLLQETLKFLAKASNSLKLNQDKEGNMSILGVPVISIGGDKIQVNDNKLIIEP